MKDIYDYLSDAPHKELLRESQEPSGMSHDYDMAEAPMTDDEIRRRRWFAQQVENAVVGVAYPVTPFVPKDGDIIYVSNGADDFDAEITD